MQMRRYQMQIVIKMTELEYEKAQLDGVLACQLIRKGTPLPKECGDLIDRDRFRRNIDYCPPFMKAAQETSAVLNAAKTDLLICLAKEQPIIEADTER